MPLVLVIEDEIRVLRSLEEGLRAAGFEVVTAATGDQGAQMATSQVFDCIVLDWMLPGRNGQQVLAELSLPPIASIIDCRSQIPTTNLVYWPEP